MRLFFGGTVERDHSRPVTAPPDGLEAEARKTGVAWAGRLTTKTQLAPGRCAGYPAGLGGRVRREREAEVQPQITLQQFQLPDSGLHSSIGRLQ